MAGNITERASHKKNTQIAPLPPKARSKYNFNSSLDERLLEKELKKSKKKKKKERSPSETDTDTSEEKPKRKSRKQVKEPPKPKKRKVHVASLARKPKNEIEKRNFKII